jgi:Protein of unknown function (DUF2786)
MDQERRKALDRILKLLALAEGTSFNAEAASARAMAEALIAKHNVDLAEGQKPPRDQLVIHTYTPWGRQWLWELMIAVAMTRLCGCAFYSRGKPDEGGYDHFLFVGVFANVEACLYILAEVHAQRHRAWVRYRAEGGRDSFGQFCFSFARGLEAKIKRLTAPAQLTETQRAALWFEATHKVSTPSDPIRGRGSSEAGRDAGASASLHRGAVGGGPQRRIGL